MSKGFSSVFLTFPLKNYRFSIHNNVWALSNTKYYNKIQSAKCRVWTSITYGGGITRNHLCYKLERKSCTTLVLDNGTGGLNSSRCVDCLTFMWWSSPLKPVWHQPLLMSFETSSLLQRKCNKLACTIYYTFIFSANPGLIYWVIKWWSPQQYVIFILKKKKNWFVCKSSQEILPLGLKIVQWRPF